MGKSTSATSYTKNNASVLLPIPHGQIDQCDLIHEKQCFCPAPHSTWANRPVRPHTRKTMLLSCSPFHMGLRSSQYGPIQVRKWWGPVCLPLRMGAFAFHKRSEVICALSGPDQQFLIVKNFSPP